MGHIDVVDLHIPPRSTSFQTHNFQQLTEKKNCSFFGWVCCLSWLLGNGPNATRGGDARALGELRWLRSRIRVVGGAPPPPLNVAPQRPKNRKNSTVFEVDFWRYACLEDHVSVGVVRAQPTTTISDGLSESRYARRQWAEYNVMTFIQHFDWCRIDRG